MGGISIPALLRSNRVRINAVDLQQGAGWIFPVIRGARTDATTEERMIQIQLRPEVEAPARRRSAGSRPSARPLHRDDREGALGRAD
jgi:hypothetical protein